VAAGAGGPLGDEEMQGDEQPADATGTSSENPIEDGGVFELADDMLL
jgi:hypothetical protein